MDAQVGFCPYRARLVAANFLVRLLGLNWQDGQNYFAKHQLDYDWTINDCNWHWVASMAMYFTLFVIPFAARVCLDVMATEQVCSQHSRRVDSGKLV